MSTRRRQYSPPPSHLGGGRYELLKPIGTGGMAMVYQVRDHREGVERAMKLLGEEGATKEKTRTRFLNEARTMSKLAHPHIVQVFDIGEEGAHYFFVMELAANGSLSTRSRQRGALPLTMALRLGIEALRGLGHAHENGVVHRDVKPHNILLADRDTVKLSDFGIARVLSDDDSLRITGTGDMLGTMAYMAPEQRLDPRNVGPEADIYSIGATLYMMVTGRRPMDLAMAKLDPTVMERLPMALRPIVRKAIAHRPEDRFRSADAMANEVQAVLDTVEPVDTPPPAPDRSPTLLSRVGGPDFSFKD